MSATEEATTHADWVDEGTALFGKASRDWSFQCPVCDHVASLSDWVEAGASREDALQRAPVECIGRLVGGTRAFEEKGGKRGEGPCDYAAFGLFRFGRAIKMPATCDSGAETVHYVFPFPKGATS